MWGNRLVSRDWSDINTPIWRKRTWQHEYQLLKKDHAIWSYDHFFFPNFSIFTTSFDKCGFGCKKTNKTFKHTFTHYAVVLRWQICNCFAGDTCYLLGVVESRQGVSAFLTAILAYTIKFIRSYLKLFIIHCNTHPWHILRAHQHTQTHHSSSRCFVRTVTVELPARLTYERLTWKITTTTLPSGQYTQQKKKTTRRGCYCCF